MSANATEEMPVRPIRRMRVPWKPAPALQASAWLHLLGLGAVAAQPQSWPAWLGVLLANHAALAGVGLWPRSQGLGPNLTRLPPQAAARGEVALTFDDGPHPEVTPRVLDLLDEARMRATFFCVGERVRRHAALAREMTRRGHVIENHTETHPHAFSVYGWRRMSRQVAQAQASIGSVTGRAPQFFRAVAGLRNPLLDPILHRQGLLLASWTRRGYDTRCADAGVVTARLTRGLAAGDVLLLHDGNSALAPDGRPVVLAVLPRLLQALRGQRLRSVPLNEAFKGGEAVCPLDKVAA